MEIGDGTTKKISESGESGEWDTLFANSIKSG
jgi:hypothetical protein